MNLTANNTASLNATWSEVYNNTKDSKTEHNKSSLFSLEIISSVIGNYSNDIKTAINDTGTASNFSVTTSYTRWNISKSLCVQEWCYNKTGDGYAERLINYFEKGIIMTVDEGLNNSFGHGFNRTVEDYLKELNLEFAHRVLSAVIVLAALMVVGVVGNLFVLFVYTCQSKRGTVTLFIRALAVFDLLSCCVAIPGEIIDMTHNYTFGSHPLCKVVRTVNLFCTVSSGVTLVVVAIDRYKRICSPLRRQISPKGAVTIISCCVIISLVVSLPTAHLYGGRTVLTRQAFINGTDCSVSDRFVNTIFPLAYNSLQMLLFLVGAVTLTVLYILIGSKICHHAHQQVKRRQSINMGLSRFSPGSPSECFSYSTNMDNIHRIKSDTSIPTEEVKEVTARLKVTDKKHHHHCLPDTKKGPIKMSLDKKDCLRQNNNDENNCTSITNLTEQDQNNLRNDEQCLQTNTGFTNDGTDDADICCHTHTTDAGNKYHRQTKYLPNNTSGLGPGLDRRTVTKSLPQEVYLEENSQEHKQTNGRFDFIKNCPQDTKLNISLIQNVTLICFKSENYINNPSNASTTDSTTSVPTTLRCKCIHQSLRELCCQRFQDFPLTNNTMQLDEDAHNSFSASTVPIPLNIHSINSNSIVTTSLLGDQPETQEKQTQETLSLETTLKDSTISRTTTDNNKPTRSLTDLQQHVQLQTDFELQTTDTLSVVTDQLQNRAAFKEKKGTEKLNKNNGVANYFILRRTKKIKKSGSFRHKQYMSLGYFSEKSELTLMNKSFDGNTSSSKLMERGIVKGHKYKNGTRRTTLMLFLITIIYIFSFLPHLILMTLKALDEDSLSGHGPSWELAQNLLIRSYFINSMANPIIYSFFSRNFFRECSNSCRS